MWENLVVTSVYGCLPVQTLGEGKGRPKTTRRWVEKAIFSYWEMRWCFWATGVFLDGKWHDHRCFWKRGFCKSLACLAKWFSLTEVKFTTWEKISNIYKWKEKVQKITQLSFWWKAKSSSYEICLRGIHLFLLVLLQTWSAQRLSSQHFTLVPMPNIAELFFSVHNHGFCSTLNTFSEEKV